MYLMQIRQDNCNINQIDHMEFTQYNQIDVDTEKAVARPRIFLNDSPLQLTLNKTLLSSTKNSMGRTHISLPISPPSHANSKPNTYFTSPEQQRLQLILQKQNSIEADKQMHEMCHELRSMSMSPHQNKRKSPVNNLSDTNTSAYFSGSPSYTLSNKGNHESGHSFSLSSGSSSYISNQTGDETSYRMVDSLDMYNYRQHCHTPTVVREPITPTTTAARASAKELFSTPSATPNRQVNLDKSFVASPGGATNTNHPMMTSSPFRSAIDWDNIVVPDDLNDSLEKVEFRLNVLKMFGYKSPPPEKMAKKRQLIQAYANEVLQKEGRKKSTSPLSVFNRMDIRSPAKTPKIPEQIQEEDEAFFSLEDPTDYSMAQDMSIVPTAQLDIILNGNIRKNVNDVPNYALIKEVEDRLIELGCEGEETPYIIYKRNQIMRELALKELNTETTPRSARSASKPKSVITRTMSIDQSL